MRTCLVTGASRGIGLAVSRALARKGHNIILSARNPVLLEKALAGLPNDGTQKHKTMILDYKELPQKIDFGDSRIDTFVNCAGVSPGALLAAQPLSLVDETLNINLKSPIAVTKAVLRNIIRHKAPQADIVYLTSILAQRGLGGMSIYSAAKAGIEGFARSLAREVGPRNIKVNCVAPGLVDTDMGRAANYEMSTSQNVFEGFIDADAVAAAVLFILENKSVTGTVVNVDNGFCA